MKASDYYGNIKDRTAAWSPNPSIPPQNDFFRNLSELIAASGTGGRYLDIGCQSGSLVRRVQDCFDESFGIDLGSYAEEWKSIPKCKFMVHNLDATGLPFPDAYFRVVSCIMVLEHVFDVFGLLRETRRVIKPGGMLVLEVPNIGYIKHIASLIMGRVPRTGAKLYPFSELSGWDGQHLHHFTIKESRWLLEYSGFRVKQVFSRGRWQGIRRVCPTLLYASIVMVVTVDE